MLVWEGGFETNYVTPELLLLKTFCSDDFVMEYSKLQNMFN